MILGEIIQELRKDKNLDQKDLAELLNVTTGTISNYETGTHNPSYESLIKLADFFNVSVDYLLGHTELRCALSDFNRKISDDCTLGSLINDVINLPSREQKLLAEYVELLKLRK